MVYSAMDQVVPNEYLRKAEDFADLVSLLGIYWNSAHFLSLQNLTQATVLIKLSISSAKVQLVGDGFSITQGSSDDK